MRPIHNGRGMAELGRIIDNALEAVRPLVEGLREGAWGGKLIVADPQGFVVFEAVLAFKGCEIGYGTLPRYAYNAGDKMERLRDNPDHLSAWQTRDTEADPPRYGGGFTTVTGWQFTFSGFPEHLDELLCMIIATDLELLGSRECVRILRLSENTFAQEHFRFNELAG